MTVFGGGAIVSVRHADKTNNFEQIRRKQLYPS
jgi:hypothetical protein